MGYDEGCGRNVGGEDLGGGEFFRKCDGDAAGAGTDVRDGEIFAGEFGRAASFEFADSEAIEGDFDQMFGFGAGNQDVGSDFEIEAPEFLVAGEMLRRFARGATLEESEIGFGGLGVEEFFGVRIEPSAVAAKNVEKEKFGGESVRGDAGFAEEMDSLLEGGADGRGNYSQEQSLTQGR